MNELGSKLDTSKLKLKLKKWELQFQERNGRKPNKDDISKSSDKIQDSYRNYLRITRSIGEGTQVKTTVSNCNENKSESLPFVWDSSLNKTNVGQRATKSKKVLSGNLATYANKLQANANLLQRNSSEQSFDLKCHKTRIETKNDVGDDRFQPTDEEDDSKLHMFGCDIKVNDTTKGESHSKTKVVNFASIPVENRIVRRQSVTFNPGSSDVRVVDDCGKTANSCSKSVFEGVRVSNMLRDCATNLISVGSLENPALKNLYEFDEVENIEGKSNVGKRKWNNIGKASVDEATQIKPRKRLKAELENEASLEQLKPIVVKRCNMTQKRKEGLTETSKKGPEVESRKEFETESVGETLSRKPRQTKRRKEKKALTNDRDAIEAEDEFRSDRSLHKKGVSKRNTMRKPSTQRENYVRINLKKKVFCRGQKKFNYRRYKYGQWKQLKQQTKPFVQCDDFKDDECPQSPETGASAVPKKPFVVTNLDEKGFEVDSDTPALLSGHDVADPVCELVDGELPPDVELDVRKALKLFGHSDFRGGQLDAIKRILGGLSTLLIQPTGSGKSLCYLLPAYIYAKRSNAITIVVSPLVSLMDDQLAGVPKCLSAACHHTGMTATQRQKVRESVGEGKVDVLFLSPEGLVSGAGTSIGCLPREMPPIAFVCIDEIHCVSAWSHNFRPSYLRLCRVVRDVLGVSCILGLTATATVATANNISQHLGVLDDSLSIIKSDVLPENLHLSVSRENTEEALLNLLKSDPFVDFNSIIVYCIRREQTERLATIIRTCLQKESSDWTAEAYHAGLSASNRRSIQKRFMTDKLRVVVATVAFGMGLNKADVRAVIHFNMPKSVESYVQEIGRAGRDGDPAYCHLFLDLLGGDRQELRRHIYANTVDRAAVKKLLSNIFRPCRCNSLKSIEDTLAQGSGDSSERTSWKCCGHEVAYVIDDAVEELDIKEEGIDTLLCYLESHESQPIKLLNRTYGKCIVFSYGGAKQLAALAEKCPAIAIALALQRKKIGNFVPSNQIEFNLMEVAAMLGQESHQLRKQVKKLQWITQEVNGVIKYRKSNFVVDFKGVAFHLKAVGDLSNDQLDLLTDYLHKRIVLQERIELGQLDKFYSVLHGFSTARYGSDDEQNVSRSRQLKETIRCHFNESVIPVVDTVDPCSNSVCLESVEKADAISNSIRRFLGIHGDTHFTGRAIARIFHGIGSPRYPADAWGKARQFWRCYMDVDFNILCKLATQHILSLTQKPTQAPQSSSAEETRKTQTDMN